MASKVVRSPVFLGILIGILAAFLQALLSSAGGPEAYGFCVACHTRDLINRIYNELFTPTPALGMAPISAASAFASLAIVGVLIGGFISAKVNKEFKLKKGSILSYALYLVGGIAVMIFALLLGACPYRAALRLGYGDLTAGIGILAMALGVFIGGLILLKKMEKEAV
jgi:hypothetical protein